MLLINTPRIDAIPRAETSLNILNHKNKYKINPTIPVVAITNKKLLSGEASAWLAMFISLRSPYLN